MHSFHFQFYAAQHGVVRNPPTEGFLRWGVTARRDGRVQPTASREILAILEVILHARGR